MICLTCSHQLDILQRKDGGLWVGLTDRDKNVRPFGGWHLFQRQGNGHDNGGNGHDGTGSHAGARRGGFLMPGDRINIYPGEDIRDETIWKYPLPFPQDMAEIMMPYDAQVLCVQLQSGSPCLWVRVNAEQQAVCMKRFRIMGTGHPLRLEPFARFRHDYVGTFQLAGGDFIFHVFELR